MPLKDHFHPPLSERRHWHAFHNAWAANLAADLNQRLPQEYFAEPNVQFGIEIDVATFEEVEAGMDTRNQQANVMPWRPPEPVRTIPLPLDEESVEVAIYSAEAGPTLVAALELVSPANKDRADHREAFVSKCETYLHQGLGLAIVDIVTSRRGSLHHELLDRLHSPNDVPVETPLYASAYRPIHKDGRSSLEIWANTIEINDVLPVMPLWLRGGPCVPIKLETTYHRTCTDQRI